MRKLALIVIVVLAISCKKESQKSSGKPFEITEAIGKEIFEGKGNCITCHQVDQKVLGPSIQEIAKIYKTKNGNMVSFFRGKCEPIVDPGQYEVMRANL